MNHLRSLFVALALTTALAACGSTSESNAGAPAESSETTAVGTDTTVAAEESTDTTVAEDAAVDAESMLISGSIVLEEGATLEPGGVLTVQLDDMTMSDPVTKVRASTVVELADATTPIPFEVVVARADLDPALRYSIKATISDAAGTVLWTTRSANFIEVEVDANDLGELTLVSAS